jgi:hypothetical protein
VDNQMEVKRWPSHWGVVSGAVLGALGGYLLTTPEGRRICDAAIQLLENFSHECARFGQAAARAQTAAADGWRAVEETLGGGSNRPTAH